jgi:hypothetical protein
VEGLETLILRLRVEILVDSEVVVDPPYDELDELLFGLLEFVELILQRSQHILKDSWSVRTAKIQAGLLGLLETIAFVNVLCYQPLKC